MIWVGGITACLVFGLGAWSSFAQYRAAVGRPDAFRAMTDYILSRQRPGDAAMFFTAAAHMSFNYYASFAAPDRRQYLPKIVLPDFGDAPSGAQPIPSAQEVRNASEGYRTVWLVLNMTSVGHTPARRAAAPMIVSTLEEKFELSERVRIGNFWVVRFVRKSG